MYGNETAPPSPLLVGFTVISGLNDMFGMCLPLQNKQYSNHYFTGGIKNQF